MKPTSKMSNAEKALYYKELKRKKNNPFLHKLIPKKTACVYAMAVRYICVEINPCKTVAIPEHLHLDIVKSLE
jgi:hypothetical protein